MNRKQTKGVRAMEDHHESQRVSKRESKSSVGARATNELCCMEIGYSSKPERRAKMSTEGSLEDGEK